ncbi:hypothetical protein SAVIM40S_02295 [Streptomyces avidinii]
MKLNSLAQAAIQAMVVDNGLNKIDKLYDLSMELKKVPPGRITMTTMPWVYSDKPGLDGRVEPMAGEAEAVFRMVREDIALDGKGSGTPADGASPSPGASASAAAPSTAPSTAPAAAPAKIAVSVRNATGGKNGTEARVKNRANDVAALLVGKGFTKATAENQTGAEDTTVIRFATDAQAADAGALATALGLPAASVQKSEDVPGITLFVGKDWRTGNAPRPPPPARPWPGPRPTRSTVTTRAPACRSSRASPGSAHTEGARPGGCDVRQPAGRAPHYVSDLPESRCTAGRRLRDHLVRQRLRAGQEAEAPAQVHGRQGHRDLRTGLDPEPLAGRDGTRGDRREVAGRDGEAEGGDRHAHDHARGDRADEGRRGQVAQVDGARVVAGHHVPPASVVLVLLGQGPYKTRGRYWTISSGENQISPPASRMRKFSSQSWARMNSSL